MKILGCRLQRQLISLDLILCKCFDKNTNNFDRFNWFSFNWFSFTLVFNLIVLTNIGSG